MQLNVRLRSITVFFFSSGNLRFNDRNPFLLQVEIEVQEIKYSSDIVSTEKEYWLYFYSYIQHSLGQRCHDFFYVSFLLRVSFRDLVFFLWISCYKLQVKVCQWNLINFHILQTYINFDLVFVLNEIPTIRKTSSDAFFMNDRRKRKQIGNSESRKIHYNYITGNEGIEICSDHRAFNK